MAKRRGVSLSVGRGEKSMKGMPGPLKDKKGRPTRKALALKRWRC
jgi:hypothetical protein